VLFVWNIKVIFSSFSSRTASQTSTMGPSRHRHHPHSPSAPAATAWIPSIPAAQVVGGDKIIKGALYDEDKLTELAAGCDVVTVEIEHVGVEGLRKLEERGVNVQPASRVIGIIQDKFVQKVSWCDLVVVTLELVVYLDDAIKAM
jgi:hypothetical protein